MSNTVVVSVSASDGSLRPVLLQVCPQCDATVSQEDNLSPGTSQMFKTKGEPRNDKSLPQASPGDQAIPRWFLHDLWLDGEDSAWLWEIHTEGTGHDHSLA